MGPGLSPVPRVTTDLTAGYWLKCSEKGGNFPDKDRSVGGTRVRISRFQKRGAAGGSYGALTEQTLSRVGHHMVKDGR